MNYARNGILRKRRVKKNLKTKRIKRPKLFAEIGFDSSNDESTNRKPDYSEHHLLDLTPSKSENDSCESLMVENSEITDTSHAFSDLSSDEDISQVNGSVVDQFKSDCDGDSSVEIVSVDVKIRNEINTRKKQMKNKKHKLRIVDEFVVNDAKIDSASNGTRDKKKKIKKPQEVSLLKTAPTGDNDDHLQNFNEQEQVYHTNDGIIVILTQNERIYLHGLCLLSVLQGEIEILGHILNKNSPEIKFFSLRGSSLLYIQNVSKTQTSVMKYLLDLRISQKIKQNENCAVILCKKLDDPHVTFIEKHISQQVLPRENQHFPRVVFQPKESNFNLLKVNDDWENVVRDVTPTTKLMICGGKGVGKTTFLRYAINRLLMKYTEIRVIDLDPGQSEFAIPGCVSLVRVRNPIFGPNYTHLQETERSVVSNINISYEPDRYIDSVKQLLNTNLDEIPTLVNYMGFTHGMGINILAAVITCVQPTHLVQICSVDSKRNYKDVLESHVIEEKAKLFVPEFAKLNYNFQQIWSLSDQNDGWTAEPRQLREMCILAYVSRIIRSDSIFTAKTPHYRISLRDITLCDLKGENIHPAAVNASLIVLCRVENEVLSLFQCLGWGIVRGVDSSTDELVILTSEKLEILDQVTHLVSGGINLPPSIYMTPDNVVGPIPYVMEGVLMSFGQIPKRSRITAKSI